MHQEARVIKQCAQREEQLAWRHAVHPDAVGSQFLRQSFCEGHQRRLADGVPACTAAAQSAGGKAIAPRHVPDDAQLRMEPRP